MTATQPEAISAIKAKLLAVPAVQSVEVEIVTVFRVISTLKPNASTEDRYAVYDAERELLTETDLMFDFYVEMA